MKRAFACLLIAVTLHPIMVKSAHAAPTQRGFQVPLNAITSDAVNDWVDNWKLNIIRVQIGDNSSMDGVVGADYEALMEKQFTILDQKLPLLQARGLKMIFCLSSPPGGFELREAPSHFLMFSRPALQEEFIAMWRTIVQRYGSSPSIEAFDLSNEPAQRKGALAAGARSWETLAIDTIAAIRETHPTVPIIVAAIYGDPSKLKALRVVADPNVSYAYNPYIWSKYQGQGDVSAPFSRSRPSDVTILASIRRRVGSFFMKSWNLVESKQLPASAYPPKVVVAEAAVSGCAPEGGAFMNGLLTALETDDSASSIQARNRILARWRRKRLRNRRLRKPIFTVEDFYRDVAHAGYTIHAFGEAQIWDPRFVCNAEGQLSPSPVETDRALTMKGFFGLN